MPRIAVRLTRANTVIDEAKWILSGQACGHFFEYDEIENGRQKNNDGKTMVAGCTERDTSARHAHTDCLGEN